MTAQVTPQPAPVVTELPTADTLAASWPMLVQALIAVLITLVVLRLAQSWSVRAMVRARIDPGTRILVGRMVSITVLVIGVMTVLGILGVSPATLVTVLGAIGLAASLALQDILKNFFAGIYLLLERPFRVGDVIRVKEQQGVVEEVGIRTTRLRTTENVLVLVPNALVFAEVVSNHTFAQASASTPPATDNPATSPPASTSAAAATATGHTPGGA